jgi:hypothetical protein
MTKLHMNAPVREPIRIRKQIGAKVKTSTTLHQTAIIYMMGSRQQAQ